MHSSCTNQLHLALLSELPQPPLFMQLRKTTAHYHTGSLADLGWGTSLFCCCSSKLQITAKLTRCVMCNAPVWLEIVSSNSSHVNTSLHVIFQHAGQMFQRNVGSSQGHFLKNFNQAVFLPFFRYKSNHWVTIKWKAWALNLSFKTPSLTLIFIECHLLTG